MKLLTDFLTGAANENANIRMVRMALLCAAAAGIEKLISMGITLPQGWVWATPLLLGVLAGADKWLLRRIVS